MVALMPTPQASDEMPSLQLIYDAAPGIQSKHTPSRDIELPITPELEALGVNSETALKLSAAYASAASRLKGLYDTWLRDSFSELDHDLNSQDQCSVLFRLNSALSEKCQLGLQQWKGLTLRMSRSAVSRNTAISLLSNKARQAFNQDSVPFLEKYFEYNSYPSAADRAVLARKAELTPRQVEVWFQNHRNRAKKAGKPMKRLRRDEFPCDFSLEGIAEKVSSLKQRSFTQSPEAYSATSTPEPSAITPQTTRISYSTSEHLSTITPILCSTRLRKNILDVVRPPPHAFPSSFQPPERPNPSSPQQLPSNHLDWYRHPARKLVRRTVPTVDELCESFRLCLNLRKRRKRSHIEAFTEEETPTSPWSPATYTILSATRHPALVVLKRSCFQVSQPQQLCNSNPPCPPQPCSEPTYPALPRHSEATGFLKYQHQTAKLSNPPSTHQNISPHQLRRRSSASSVESSAGCSTPTLSPTTDVHSLPDDPEVLRDTLSDTLLWDRDVLPPSKKLRSQDDSYTCTPCHLTPPLLYSV